MLITLMILITYGFNNPCHSCFKTEEFQWIASTPYFFVLVLAISGVNVFLILTFGILSAGLIGFSFTPNYNLITYAKNIYQGYMAACKKFLSYLS